MEFVGIDKFSLLDYDENVSVVLFAPACNFRCPFCHNGQSVLSNNAEIPFDEILDFLKTRIGLIDAVVVTGGEPTLMPDLIEKIERIRALGFKIKLDSNGTNPEVLRELLRKNLLDYIAMDIKNSEEKYAVTAGLKTIDLTKIKQSIKIIMDSGIDYEFRTTLVAEYHTKDDMKGIGELIKGAKKLYLQKFVDREGVIKKGLHHIEQVWADSFKDVLEDYVTYVSLRGY